MNPNNFGQNLIEKVLDNQRESSEIELNDMEADSRRIKPKNLSFSEGKEQFSIPTRGSGEIIGRPVQLQVFCLENLLDFILSAVFPKYHIGSVDSDFVLSSDLPF